MIIFFLYLFLGIFSTLSINYFLIFIGRRYDKSYLFYSLLCASMVFIIISKRILPYYYPQNIILNKALYILSIISIAIVSHWLIHTLFKVEKMIIFSIIYCLLYLTISLIMIILYLFYSHDIIFIIIFLISSTLYAVFVLGTFIYYLIKFKLYKQRKEKIIISGFITLFLSYILSAILTSIQLEYSVYSAYSPYLFFSLIILYGMISDFNKEHFELKKAKQQLEIHNIELENIVKERTKELEIEKQNKVNMLITISHEMKTTLTIILNNLEDCIKKYSFLNKLNISYNYLIQLKRIMTNLLTQEKIKEKVFYEHSIIINFTNYLKEIISNFKEIAKNKKIKIIYNIANNLFIKIDDNALNIIINNLIDNAIKYTKEKGLINISLKEKNNKIEFIIQDTGIGIDKKEIDYIFKPFSQLSNGKNQLQGMGLGLSIVKEILDNINAKIKVTSKLNEGSTFKIIFDRYIPNKRDIIQNDYSFSKDSIISSYIPESIISETEIYNENKFTVLLVEDNLEMVSFLQNNLKKEYNFYYSSNGQQALQKLQNMPKPDIIISDIMMDVMDGYEFYDNIKNNNFFNNIPFLFLTAKSELDEKIKGLSKGAIDFITKPFNLEELLAKIKSILKINKIKEKSIIKSIYETSKKQLEDLNNNKINYDEIKEKYNLTNNEIEICKLIKEKLSNKEIGKILNKAESTVKNYIQIIFQKLSVNKREKVIDILLKYKESTF